MVLGFGLETLKSVSRVLLGSMALTVLSAGIAQEAIIRTGISPPPAPLAQREASAPLMALSPPLCVPLVHSVAWELLAARLAAPVAINPAPTEAPACYAPSTRTLPPEGVRVQRNACAVKTDFPWKGPQTVVPCVPPGRGSIGQEALVPFARRALISPSSTKAQFLPVVHALLVIFPFQVLASPPHLIVPPAAWGNTQRAEFPARRARRGNLESHLRGVPMQARALVATQGSSRRRAPLCAAIAVRVLLARLSIPPPVMDFA